jgi:integrase
VLETAVEYGFIASNPASGKQRRLKASKPARPWVEPEQLMALLDAAKADHGQAGVGRVLLGLLAGSGLRIGEALALRWQNVDTGTGSLHVVDAKTPKGIREVHLTTGLREVSSPLWRADALDTLSEGDYVTTLDRPQAQPSNLRRDVLVGRRTGERDVDKAGIAEIGPITFHSLRRSSRAFAARCGDDVRHGRPARPRDPRFTLRVYAQATKRRERPREAAAGPRPGIEWAQLGATDLTLLMLSKTREVLG